MTMMDTHFIIFTLDSIHQGSVYLYHCQSAILRLLRTNLSTDVGVHVAYLWLGQIVCDL